MGIYINYTLQAEGSDDDLLARLRRLRKRFLQLPLDKVGRIQRLDPVYMRMHLDQLKKAGYRLPKAIRDRLKGKWSTRYAIHCHLVGQPDWMDLPKKLLTRFYRPARDFIKKTRLWKEDELPEKVTFGSLTVFRKGFSYEFANVMLRRGYLMILDPGEGCETVAIGLSTLGGQGVPLWLGSGFAKTQYATHFIDAHENVCRILDCVKEEGLLMEASDTCDFYKHRDWKKAAPIVNLETTFAHVMKGAFSAAVASANEQGAEIQDLSDPATRNYNLIQVTDEEKSEE
jgi:hypothetical protein